MTGIFILSYVADVPNESTHAELFGLSVLAYVV